MFSLAATLARIALPDGGDLISRDMVRALSAEAGAVRFVIEAPYVRPKFHLLTGIARANHCETVLHTATDEATIVGYGAGCAPVLLDALKHGQKPELVAELTKILDGFMEKQYVPLLEAEWTGTDEVRDAYIISTIKRFGVEGHGELFAKGLVHGDPAITAGPV